MKKNYPYFDGHNDVLLKLQENNKKQSFLEENLDNDIDYKRALESGFFGGLFSIFVSNDPLYEVRYAKIDEEDTDSRNASLPPALNTGYAMNITNQMLAILLKNVRESAGKLRLVRTFDDIENARKEDAMAAVIHFEGADTLDPALDNLAVYHEAGLRSLGIVWSRPNNFGHGVPFRFPSTPDTGPGLTEMGKLLVRKCNDYGIIVDLAHITEKGFWDTAAITTKPMVVSHSSAWQICHSTRALTDRQLDAIGETNGIVGINFHVNDFRPDGKSVLDTPLSMIASHIHYIADRIGVDHIGIGSDFDGARIPASIGDVTGIQKLFQHLAENGFNTEEIEQISHRNWLRILKETMI